MKVLRQCLVVPLVTFLVTSVVCIPILFLGCGDDENPENPMEPEPVDRIPTMQKETRTGVLDLSTSNLEPKDLKVLTFAEQSNLDEKGKFSILAPEADKPQLIFFNSRTTNNPIYIGLYDPLTRETEANERSTALALTLINPYLISSTAEQRQEYLQAVRENPRFEELVALLQDAYQTDPTTALVYDSNPIVFQALVQLMKETVESLSVGAAPAAPGFLVGDPPYIDDADGDDIVFINSRYVYYTAGVYPNAGNQLKEIVSINRKEKILQWGWNPIVQPAETTYTLGDGYFHLYLTRGFDFKDPESSFNLEHPEGLATIYNTGQTLLYIADLVIGKLPVPPITDLPRHLKLSWEDTYSLANSLASGELTDVIIAFGDLLESNAKPIADWIWQETGNQGVYQFAKTATELFKKVSFVYTLLSAVNEQLPFIKDLIFAPRTASYYVTQQNGKIINIEQNRPPQVEFSFDPPAGIVGTRFSFDASLTFDDKDDVAVLEFRWDWDTDGIWDTGWRQNPAATHVYEKRGSYTVNLEVRDTRGLVGSITHILSVGGGADTATHIKLFRDNLPWDSNSMVIALEDLGFTEGQGEHTYEIIESTEMDTVPLIPGEDLVIISNDQNQNYYNNYAASQIRFRNFVYTGGSLFFGACDEGWASGSISDAGIVVPGNITITFDLDRTNHVVQLGFPLVEGLPETLNGNYSSHENFTNLPDGTIVYCRDTTERATLVEFNLGAGWMIVTGQPLEWGYDRHEEYSIGLLLPRVISHFTGFDLPAAPSAIPTVYRSNRTLVNKPSHMPANDILSTTWGETKSR